MTTLIIVLAAVVILTIIRQAFTHREPNWFQTSTPADKQSTTMVTTPVQPQQRRYSRRSSILTPAEIAFHRVLIKVAPQTAICPKVRLADVIEAQERYSGAFLRISQKHFDWVLCDPVDFRPLVAIELDDSSHNFRRQQKNDLVKDSAAEDAGITLLRFAWSNLYDEEAIRQRIASTLDRVNYGNTKAQPVSVHDANVAKVRATLDADFKRRYPDQDSRPSLGPSAPR